MKRMEHGFPRTQRFNMLSGLLSAVVENWPRFELSLWVWSGFLVVFLAIELPPVFWSGCPWETLSNTSWDSQSVWHPAKLIFALFFLVLALHIIQRIPAAWLITVVVGSALALLIHLIIVRTGHHPAWLAINEAPKSYMARFDK